MSVEGGGGIGAGLKSFGPKFESVAYSPIDRVVGKGEFKNMNDFKILRFAPSVKEDTSVVSEEVTATVDPGESIAKEIWTDLTEQKELTADVLERAIRARAAVQQKTEIVPGIVVEPQPQIVPNIVDFQQINVAPQQAEYTHLSTPRMQSTASRLKVEEQQVETPKAAETFSPIPAEEQVRPKIGQDIALEKRRIVRDGKALFQRISDGLAAIKIAFGGVDKKEKTGKDVKIPEEYDGVRSTALRQEKVEDIPDGGYELYKQGVEARIVDLTSPMEIARVIEEEAYKNEPVKRDDGGGEKRVGQDAVHKVFMHASQKPPVEEVNIRISKKEVVISEAQLFEVPGTSGERRIQDDPDLAELFKLAA